MSFLEQFNNFDRSFFAENLKCQDDLRIEQLIASGNPKPGLETFSLLLSPAASKFIEALAQLASQLTFERHGKVIRLYAPAYMSNECTNTCTY